MQVDISHIPLLIANVDQDVFNRSPSKDQTTISAIGWAIIIAAIVAGGSVFYFLYILTNSGVLGFLGALIVILVVYFLDRTLLRDERPVTLIVRLLISLVLAIFISMPIKVRMSEAVIKDAVIHDANNFNQELYLNEVIGLQQKMDDKLQDLNDCIQVASEMVNGKLAQTQLLVECRRQKKELKATWDQRIAEAEISVQDQLITADTSFVNLLGKFVAITLGTDNHQKPLTWYLNFAIFLFFMITEALPSILRATLQNSYYINEVRDKHIALTKIRNNRQQILDAMTNPDSIDDNDLREVEISYWNEFAKQHNDDMKDTGLLHQIRKQFEILKLRKNKSNGEVIIPDEVNLESEANNGLEDSIL